MAMPEAIEMIAISAKLVKVSSVGRFRLHPYIMQDACQLCVFNDSKGLECEVRNAGVALSCNGLRTWPNPLE